MYNKIIYLNKKFCDKVIIIKMIVINDVCVFMVYRILEL